MTAVGAQEPEVFVVYRVFEYKDKGLIFSHAGSTVASYGFACVTRRGASEKIGVVRSSGALLATADATTEKWHVANIYFGNTDGFVDVESIDSFDIAGKFDANALAELQVGGSKLLDTTYRTSSARCSCLIPNYQIRIARVFDSA